MWWTGMVALAGGPSETIRLPCEWRPGERSWKFDFTHVEVKWDADSRVENLLTATVTVRVVEASAAKVRFAYRERKTAGTGSPGHLAKIDALRAAAPLADIVIDRMADGSLTLVNPEEVGASVLDVARAWEPALDAEALDALQAMLSDPVAGPAFMLEEAGRLLVAQCDEFSVEPVERDIAWPNPFGGPAISATSRTWVQDATPTEVTLRIQDTLGDDGIRVAIDAALEASGQVASDADIAAAIHGMTSGQDSTLRMSRVDGFPLSVAATRELSREGAGSRESFTWARRGR